MTGKNFKWKFRDLTVTDSSNLDQIWYFVYFYIHEGKLFWIHAFLFNHKLTLNLFLKLMMISN